MPTTTATYEMNFSGMDSAGNYDEPSYCQEWIQRLEGWWEDADQVMEVEKETAPGEDTLMEKESEGFDDCGFLQPPGTEKTPVGSNPPIDNDLAKAPRKPFDHLFRTIQRPKTLFKKREVRPFKHFHSGNDKHVTVSRIKDRKYVDIHQFYLDSHNNGRPTQKGLVLNPAEWHKLTLLVRDINKALNECSVEIGRRSTTADGGPGGLFGYYTSNTMDVC